MAKMSEAEKSRLEIVLIDAMNDALTNADENGINHPYWSEETAVLMARAALSVVLACELPQSENAG